MDTKFKDLIIQSFKDSRVSGGKAAYLPNRDMVSGAASAGAI
jgi:hypothetical protein